MNTSSGSAPSGSDRRTTPSPSVSSEAVGPARSPNPLSTRNEIGSAEPFTTSSGPPFVGSFPVAVSTTTTSAYPISPPFASTRIRYAFDGSRSSGRVFHTVEYDFAFACSRAGAGVSFVYSWSAGSRHAVPVHSQI